jgi:leader peptidase (prepilin peptidase)/N-methyltransferase
MFVTLLPALLSGIALSLALFIAAITAIGLFHALPGYLQQRWGYAPPPIIQPKPLLQRWVLLFTQGAGALMLTVSTTSQQQVLLLPVIALLLALAIIDWQRQWLPDSLTLPLLWYGLLVNLNGNFVLLEDAVLGAVTGYLSLWLLNMLYRCCYRQDGLGHGEF